MTSTIFWRERGRNIGRPQAALADFKVSSALPRTIRCELHIQPAL